MERMRRGSSNASSTGGRQRKLKANPSSSDARTSRLLEANPRPLSTSQADVRPTLARTSSSMDIGLGMDNEELASTPGLDAQPVQNE